MYTSTHTCIHMRVSISVQSRIIFLLLLFIRNTWRPNQIKTNPNKTKPRNKIRRDCLLCVRVCVLRHVLVVVAHCVHVLLLWWYVYLLKRAKSKQSDKRNERINRKEGKELTTTATTAAAIETIPSFDDLKLCDKFIQSMCFQMDSWVCVHLQTDRIHTKSEDTQIAKRERERARDWQAAKQMQE